MSSSKAEGFKEDLFRQFSGRGRAEVGGKLVPVVWAEIGVQSRQHEVKEKSKGADCTVLGFS